MDVFLSQRCSEISRSQLKKMILGGFVLSKGRAVKASRILKGGEEIRVEIPSPEPLEITPQAIPLDIIHEDGDLLVLNKSAEMVVHPGAGIKKNTLVNAVLHHCKDLSGIGGKLRPGIVHRLDKGTSGLLLVAKNNRAHLGLSEQFSSRQIKKTYLAFVWGEMPQSQGSINIPLGRSPTHRKRISSRSRRVRPALTHYRVLKSWGVISLLELKPHTGRTHQIRVHLAESKHPVVGDPVYGRGLQKISSLPTVLQDEASSFRFQLLHANRIAFRHPVTMKEMSFEAPMRTEMKNFKRHLEEFFKNR